MAPTSYKQKNIGKNKEGRIIFQIWEGISLPEDATLASLEMFFNRYRRKYPADTKFNSSGYDEPGDYHITYKRHETDEEYNKRLATNKKREELRKKKELARYKKLGKQISART